MGIMLVRKISTPGRREKKSPLREGRVTKSFRWRAMGLGIPGMKGALRCARWLLGNGRRGWFGARAHQCRRGRGCGGEC